MLWVHHIAPNRLAADTRLVVYYIQSHGWRIALNKLGGDVKVEYYIFGWENWSNYSNRLKRIHNFQHLPQIPFSNTLVDFQDIHLNRVIGNTI